jgi:HTH-type transcriptional regulator / antitoxin HipB
MLRSMKPLWLQAPAQLANHLRSFRKARGLTQAALGALTGLDQTRIAKIERDPKRVSVGQLLQLLAVLQVRVLLDPVSEKPRAAPRAPAPQW